jgi:putative transposase
MELCEEGRPASISRICRILGVPRSTVYYSRRHRAPRPIAEDLARRIWQTIQEFPAWGIRKVWAYLRHVIGMVVNRKKVARIMQHKGWTLRQRRPRMRPRVRGWKGRAERSDQRWATDVTHVYCGRDGWCHVPIVIDCHDRELIGWRISRRGTAKVAEAALEDALIRRFGAGAQQPKELVLHSDNGLIFLARSYRQTVGDYGLSQEFITPYTPEQNGIVERVIRTLKEECVWLRQFDSIEEAERAIARWVTVYNTRRPHEALGHLTPEQARKRGNLAA